MNGFIQFRREERADGTSRAVPGWHLDKGRALMSMSFFEHGWNAGIVRPGRDRNRVLIGGRGFWVYDRDPQVRVSVIVAEDSAWCLVWGMVKVARAVNDAALGAFVDLLDRLGRYEPDGNRRGWADFIRLAFKGRA